MGGQPGCEIQDASDETALIAFQGPKAEAALSPLTSAPLAGLRRFHLLSDVKLAGRPVSIARTGYTGEDGFEIFCSPDDAPAAVGRAGARRPTATAASRSGWARGTRCAWRPGCRSTATTWTTTTTPSRRAWAGW